MFKESQTFVMQLQMNQAQLQNLHSRAGQTRLVPSGDFQDSVSVAGVGTDSQHSQLLVGRLRISPQTIASREARRLMKRWKSAQSRTIPGATTE
jgi:hypothetical protein